MRRIVAGAIGRSRKDHGEAGEIERKRPLRRKKRTIAVVGISRGAGTTFVATSLAFLLSKFVEKCRNSGETLLPACVSYVEMRRPIPGESQVFFSAGLDRRFGTGRFTDFFQLYKEGKPLNRNVNLHKGINWVVWRHSGESGGDEGTEQDHDYAGLPLCQLAGDYVVADSPRMETLRQYDLVIAVIDPMPGCVFAGAASFEKLRDLEMSGLPVLWIVNRDNSAVNHGELRRFLRLKDYLTIPLLEGRLFYESQYTCSLPVELVLKEERDGGEGRNALEKLAETVFL